MRESRDSDRFLVNTQVQSHALLRRGFSTSVPFIYQGLVFANRLLILMCFITKLTRMGISQLSSIRGDSSHQKPFAVPTLFFTTVRGQ